MSPAQLAETLELLARGLRMLPADGCVPAAPTAAPQLSAGRTVGDWLDVHDRQLDLRGYKPQTMKNRRANLKHVLRKAGGGAIEESSLSARFHEHIVAVLGESAHGLHEWPSLHEVRSLAARLYRAQGIDVQTLLGHKNAEMTAIYEDDRGLSRHEWKRVDSASPALS